MKTRIFITLLIGLAVLVIVAPRVPASDKAAKQAQGTAGKNAKGPPAIETVTFVNTPYWSSPPWYPPTEETDTYRLVMGGLRWASDDLPVDCVVYTTGAPEGAVEAVEDAFAEWENYTLTDIYDGIFVDIAPPEIGNTVSWAPIDGPGGTIAVTQFRYWVNTKELIEFDIVFDSDEDWSTTGEEDAFDVQNVMTHELGHTLALDDLRSPRDGALTMHAYTRPEDTTKRDLGSGDILGIQAIYGE